MFDDDQNAKALQWVKECIRSDIEPSPSIIEILNNSERHRRLLSWLIWIEPELSEIDRVIVSEFIDQNPELIPIGSILEEAVTKSLQGQLRTGLEQGIECGVCGQLAKEYRRAINANMAMFLKSLVVLSIRDKSNGGDGWVHHSHLTYTGRDYTMVAHWGLARTSKEQKRDGKRKKKTTGMWKPTEEGIDFVKGLTKVRSHIYMYNGSCREDENAGQVSIYDALGATFVFSELFDNTEATEGE